jgi:cytochrome c2
MSRSDRHSSPWAVGLWLIAGVAILLAVALWALGKPGKDPVGNAVLTAQVALQDNMDFLRAGPTDGAPDWEAASMVLHDADAEHGASLIEQHGCGSCHVIPGVSRAHGTVGPSLAGFRDRAYVAGVLPNRPGDLVGWLMNPTVHAPNTAMPDLGITEAQGRDMAAYLYTLQGG